MRGAALDIIRVNRVLGGLGGGLGPTPGTSAIGGAKFDFLPAFRLPTVAWPWPPATEKGLGVWWLLPAWT